MLKRCEPRSEGGKEGSWVDLTERKGSTHTRRISGTVLREWSAHAVSAANKNVLPPEVGTRRHFSCLAM